MLVASLVEKSLVVRQPTRSVDANGVNTCQRGSNIQSSTPSDVNKRTLMFLEQWGASVACSKTKLKKKTRKTRYSSEENNGIAEKEIR